MRRWSNLKVAVMLLILSLLTTGLAYAKPEQQGRSGYWEAFNVDITVNRDGTFWVEETQTLSFSGGTFTYVYRNIDMSRIKEITDVQVYDEARNAFEESSLENARTFETDMEDGDFYIRWYFPPTEGRITFIVRYRVHGALRYYDDGDQLWWKAIPEDLIARVENSTVTVNLPEGAEARPVEAYFTDARITGEGTSMVTFEALEPIPSGQEFEVRAQFPSGIVAGSPAAWQRGEDLKPVIDLLMVVVSLLLMIGGIGALLLLWYLKGRDPDIAIPADILSTPPTDDPPGIAGTLVDERTDMEDVIATLVDLARRGYLIFEEKQLKGFLGSTNREFTFKRTDKAPNDLLPYERDLIRYVFGTRSSRDLEDLKEKFYKYLPKIHKGLYKEVVERGYFSAGPQAVRGRYTALGIGLIVMGALAWISLSCVLSTYTNVPVLPGIALGIVGIVGIIVAQFMPAKTRKGKEAALKWEAFKRYVRDLERYTDLQEATDLFEKYLPYAIAFGLEKSWVRKFTQQMPRSTPVPMPMWYRPYYAPSNRTRRGMASPTEMGRASTPSLQDASDSMVGGLQSMSDGLMTMLNSTASTFKSSPSSSSSGGFSGGGGGGGGGSGGGGGGFG